MELSNNETRGDNGNINTIIMHDINLMPKEITSSTENMRFVASVTGIGLLTNQSEYKGTLTRQMVLDLGKNTTTFDPNGYRKEFIELVTNWDD